MSKQIFRTLIGRNAINLHAPVYDSVVLYRSQAPAATVAGFRILFDVARKVPA